MTEDPGLWPPLAPLNQEVFAMISTIEVDS